MASKSSCVDSRHSIVEDLSTDEDISSAAAGAAAGLPWSEVTTASSDRLMQSRAHADEMIE